jgi:hypothetical protein
MILSDDSGREYCIHFRFEDVEVLDSQGDTKKLPGTICEMHVLAPGQLRVRGETACSPSDTFIPVIGRKHALAAAFEAAKLNATARKAIWDHFFKLYPAAKTPHTALRDAKVQREINMLGRVWEDAVKKIEIEAVNVLTQLSATKEVKHGPTNL